MIEEKLTDGRETGGGVQVDVVVEETGVEKLSLEEIVSTTRRQRLQFAYQSR